MILGVRVLAVMRMLLRLRPQEVKRAARMGALCVAECGIELVSASQRFAVKSILGAWCGRTMAFLAVRYPRPEARRTLPQRNVAHAACAQARHRNGDALAV